LSGISLNFPGSFAGKTIRSGSINVSTNKYRFWSTIFRNKKMIQGATVDRERMSILLQVDWKSVFVPTVSLVEIILRGSMIYLLIFVLMRLRRRQAGGLGIADLLVVVMIADAAQNAMAGEYKSVTEGFVLVGTIVFWDYLLDYLSYRFPGFRHWITPSPLPLIQDGKMVRRNMRQELVTREELMEHLREQGIEDITDVKEACLEGDGQISVIKKEPDKEVKKQDKKGIG
jgi:uncharacterized membrane protein YcaP (DUF421 family)